MWHTNCESTCNCNINNNLLLVSERRGPFRATKGSTLVQGVSFVSSTINNNLYRPRVCLDLLPTFASRARSREANAKYGLSEAFSSYYNRRYNYSNILLRSWSLMLSSDHIGSKVTCIVTVKAGNLAVIAFFIKVWISSPSGQAGVV